MEIRSGKLCTTQGLLYVYFPLNSCLPNVQYEHNFNQG